MSFRTKKIKVLPRKRRERSPGTFSPLTHHKRDKVEEGTLIQRLLEKTRNHLSSYKAKASILSPLPLSHPLRPITALCKLNSHKILSSPTEVDLTALRNLTSPPTEGIIHAEICATNSTTLYIHTHFDSIRNLEKAIYSHKGPFYRSTHSLKNSGYLPKEQIERILILNIRNVDLPDSQVIEDIRKHVEGTTKHSLKNIKLSKRNTNNKYRTATAHLTCPATKHVLLELSKKPLYDHILLAGATADKKLHRCTSCGEFGHTRKTCTKPTTLSIIIHTKLPLYPYQIPLLKHQLQAKEINLAPSNNPNSPTSSSTIIATYETNTFTKLFSDPQRALMPLKHHMPQQVYKRTSSTCDKCHHPHTNEKQCPKFHHNTYPSKQKPVPTEEKKSLPAQEHRQKTTNTENLNKREQKNMKTSNTKTFNQRLHALDASAQTCREKFPKQKKEEESKQTTNSKYGHSPSKLKIKESTNRRGKKNKYNQSIPLKKTGIKKQVQKIKKEPIYTHKKSKFMRAEANSIPEKQNKKEKKQQIENNAISSTNPNSKQPHHKQQNFEANLPKLNKKYKNQTKNSTKRNGVDCNQMEYTPINNQEHRRKQDGTTFSVEHNVNREERQIKPVQELNDYDDQYSLTNDTQESVPKHILKSKAQKPQQSQQTIVIPKGSENKTRIKLDKINKDDISAPKKNLQLTDEEKMFIRESIKAKLPFKKLSEDHVEAVLPYFFPHTYSSEKDIIEEGNPCTKRFFVIQSGECRSKNENSEDTHILSVGDCFGTLALLSNTSRNSIITANSEKITCWVMNWNTIHETHKQEQSTKHKSNFCWLQSLKIFQSMSQKELKLIDLELQEEQIETGETIFEEGDTPDKFYIVRFGSCESVHENEDGQQERYQIEKGSIFGYSTLLTNTPRRSTILSGKTGCIVLTLKKEAFIKLLQPLEKTMSRNREKYLKRTKITNAAHNKDEMEKKTTTFHNQPMQITDNRSLNESNIVITDKKLMQNKKNIRNTINSSSSQFHHVDLCTTSSPETPRLSLSYSRSPEKRIDLHDKYLQMENPRFKQHKRAPTQPTQIEIDFKLDQSLKVYRNIIPNELIIELTKLAKETNPREKHGRNHKMTLFGKPQPGYEVLYGWGRDILMKSSKWHKSLTNALQVVANATPIPNVDPNACLLNYFPTGFQHTPAHQDQRYGTKEADEVIMIPIGEPRYFVFQSESKPHRSHKLKLENGMVLFLSKECNTQYKHSRPIMENISLPSYSFTFRSSDERRLQD